MVNESKADIASDDFDIDVAARVAIRIGMALAAADEAYDLIATELAKDAAGTVDESIRTGLLGLWNPWAQPFKDLGTDCGQPAQQVRRAARHRRPPRRSQQA